MKVRAVFPRLSVAVLGAAMCLPLLAAPASAGGASTASASSADHIRCAWQWSGTSAAVKSKAYCYFDLANSSARTALPTSDWALMYAAAGTVVTVPATYSTGIHPWSLIYNAASSFASIAASPGSCDAGTWEIGPRTSSLGVSISAGAAIWTMTASACLGYYGPWMGLATGAVDKCSGYSGGAFSAQSCKGYHYQVNSTLGAYPGVDPRTWQDIDYFPGGASSVVYTDCAGVTLVGPSSLSPHRAGDVLSFSVSWASTVLLYDMSYRFVSAPSATYWDDNGAYVVVSSTLFVGVVGPSPIGTSATFTVKWPKGADAFSLAQMGFEIRCNVTIAGVQTYQYQTYGGSGFSSTAATANSCANSTVTWPSNRGVVSGSVVSFGLFVPGSYAGAVDKIEYANGDPNGAAAPVLSSLTWTTATVTVNTAGVAVSLPATTANLPAGFSGAFTTVAGFAGDLHQVYLRCTSNSGVVTYGFQWSNIYVLGAYVGQSTCLDGVTVSVWPSSWVPALVGAVTCVVEFVFIPSQSKIDALKAAGTVSTTKSPISYLSQASTFMYGALSTAPAAVAAHRNDTIPFGAAMDITVVAAGRTSVHAVTPASNGDFSTIAGSSTFSTMRTVEGVIFWLFAVWALFMMTKRLVMD